MHDRLEEIEADLNRRTPDTDFEDRSHCRELLEMAREESAEVERLRAENADQFTNQVTVTQNYIDLKADRDRLAETVERVNRALDDEEANLADDGARLSHSVVRRLRATIEGSKHE